MVLQGQMSFEWIPYQSRLVVVLMGLYASTEAHRSSVLAPYTYTHSKSTIINFQITLALRHQHLSAQTQHRSFLITLTFLTNVYFSHFLIHVDIKQPGRHLIPLSHPTPDIEPFNSIYMATFLHKGFPSNSLSLNPHIYSQFQSHFAQRQGKGRRLLSAVKLLRMRFVLPRAIKLAPILENRAGNGAQKRSNNIQT